jgi:hypothetical protein
MCWYHHILHITDKCTRSGATRRLAMGECDPIHHLSLCLLAPFSFSPSSSPSSLVPLFVLPSVLSGFLHVFQPRRTVSVSTF